jgi:DNA-binding CsgD family transcriptional regulator
MGHYDEAIRHYETAIEIKTRVGDMQARARVIHGLGIASYMKGEYTRSRGHLEAALSYYREIGSPRYILMPLRYLGYVAVYQARYSDAADLYIEYLQVVRIHGTESDFVLGMYAVAVMSAAVQQAELATKLMAFADARRKAANVFMPAADSAQVDPTVKLLSSRVEDNLWEQWSNSGDCMRIEEALDMAFEACVLGTRIPTEGLSGDAAKTIQHSEGQNPHGLSKREIELLTLVAVGLSNAEIADRLFLSPNTVRAHLYSIYNKIDVTSRTAAAHYARNQNIV